MLGDLFDEGAGDGAVLTGVSHWMLAARSLFLQGLTILDTSVGSKNKLKSPPSARNETRLSGLENLGTTCYLNSLIQTMRFTPGFRERLFSIDLHELGVLDGKLDGPRVRTIPLQLQVGHEIFTPLILNFTKPTTETILGDDASRSVGGIP